MPAVFVRLKQLKTKLSWLWSTTANSAQHQKHVSMECLSVMMQWDDSPRNNQGHLVSSCGAPDNQKNILMNCPIGDPGGFLPWEKRLPAIVPRSLLRRVAAMYSKMFILCPISWITGWGYMRFFCRDTRFVSFSTHLCDAFSRYMLASAEPGDALRTYSS